MKICKLRLKNLNSFREEVELDFEDGPLNDASLIAITGPTGAGKTTLLDAICVALYGKTPRLGGRKGSPHAKRLISHGETQGFAEVHFIANNTCYLAIWSATQKGTRMVQLRYADSEKLITDKLQKGKSLGSSQRTVSEEVESILGLDFDAFKRSVMLAQGEFAAFLKADLKDRRKILEKTAGIGIYNKLNDKLNEKENQVREEYEHLKLQLGAISEVSCEQIEADIKAVKDKLDRLQVEDKALDGKRKRIQKDKELETKRKEDFETLQSSEERQQELLDMQPKIDALQVEQENANRAQRLLPEKQAFDNAKSELEEATAALSSTETEKTEAEEQVKTDQADFDKKAETYQDASDECNQQMKIYTNAKSDVERSEDRFVEAEKRIPDLADLDNQIKALEIELTDKQAQQTELRRQIDDTQRFLEDNPLPSDRRQRFNRVTGLLAELTPYAKQLETEQTNKANAEKKVSSLKQEIERLSDTRQKRLSEQTEAETTLDDATTQLKNLRATGTHEEWTARKQQVSKAQSIAQEYETTQDNLEAAENQLNTLNETAAELTTELEQIETDLASQTAVCQETSEVVQRCEEEKESAKWADQINQLRQRLQPGEPCSVCGATDHPCADVVETESAEQLQHVEAALTAAKAESDAAQLKRQTLKTKQIQAEQNKSNTTGQIQACTTDIDTLQEEAAKLFAKWQAIYPDTDVSSVWTSEQSDTADTAIADITKAEQARTQADGALQIVSQQLETCENNITRETSTLNDTETQLEGINNTIADLQADIKETEERFWESIPDTFHGVKPKVAVEQFENKIEEVASREDERRNAETQLQRVEDNIRADQRNIEKLRERLERLQAEIDKYRREGEEILDAVRKKTGGLETEDEINAATDTLETELQAKEDEQDEADQRLQKSRELLTQKQTTHEICEKQYGESNKKFETARQTYFNKLTDTGFDSPEAHDNAFRDDVQRQTLTDQIDAYKNEIQQLALEITEFQTRFEETPYDPDALGRIETQLGEIEAQLQEAQQEVGAQQQKIDDLKDALEKREALADELDKAEQEVSRWQRLQETIPANALRDFALEIMFKQMGNLANEQLKYLTSERYQLKVESIGDLAVVDHWNANEERPVETLSGGESFLTSLALALALSELSSGRAQLNSLFLDEGFGTLDAETLDTAIAALEGLRMQGRSIFLISHIQELTRRLPVKIEVNKKGNGSSSVRIQG